MAIPSKVRQAGEEADAEIARLKQLEVDAAEGNPDNPASNETPAVESINQSEQSTTGDSQDSEYWKNQADSWQKRFTNYKTGTDKTINQLRDDVEAIKADTEAKIEAAVEAAIPRDSLSDAEKEDYSEEFTDVVEKIAEAKSNPVIEEQRQIIASLKSRLEALEKNTAKTEEAANKTGMDSFFDDLDAEIQNWEDLQKDNRFDDFLKAYDEMSNVQYGLLLEKAQKEFNAKGAANIYRVFAKQTGLSINPIATNLDANIVPEASGSGDGDPTRNEKVYTVAEVEAFYKDYATGQLKISEADYKAEDKRISVALSENRVR
ncbi:MAG: hypothetical protein KAS93_07940 [Gammaproteobacteria bacterium]|nr:hypothetical protein [Gammaproteobacteria bacterium]